MLAHFSMSKAQFPCLPQRAGTGWSSIAGIATPRTQPPSTHPRSLMCASHSRREALMLATIAAPLLSHPTSQALPLAPLGAVQVGENKRTGITIQELKDILARDIGEGMYFVTGNLSPEVFDDNCRFIDPTNDVTGLSRYMKALSILFDPALSKVVLKDIKVTSPSTIDADWVSAGWLKKELFPWQPKVPPFEGRRNPALKTLSRGSEDALTSSTERKSCVSINQSKALRGKGMILQGHTEPVTCVCASGNGSTCVSGHTKDVNAVSISWDGQVAVSGGDDMTVRVWDLSKLGASTPGKLTSRALCRNILYGHTGIIRALALSLDASLCISGSDDNSVRVWDLAGSYKVPCRLTMPGHTSYVSSVAVTSNSEVCITGSADLTLRVWDLQQGTCTAVLRGHTMTVVDVALGSNDKTVVSASLDLTIKVWDLRQECMSCINTISGFTCHPSAIGITPSGRTILAAFGSKLMVYESSGDVWTMLTGHTGSIRCLSVMGRRGVATAGGSDKTVRVWSLNE